MTIPHFPIEAVSLETHAVPVIPGFLPMESPKFLERKYCVLFLQLMNTAIPVHFKPRTIEISAELP
jgi:hypothetical protein